MLVDSLVIPDLLQTMLAEGRWPRTSDEATQQNLQSRIPDDRNRTLRRIYLYSPPFQTVAKILIGSGEVFYTQFGALHELVPERSIAIADLGLGADTPILLDYRNDVSNPRVIHLEWPGAGLPNYWVEMAPDFASFVKLVGL